MATERSVLNSRPGDRPRPEGGATSDHWLDVEALKLEPLFESNVQNSFAPVGIMLDFWDSQVMAGQKRQINVIVTNDLEKVWNGTVRCKIVGQDKTTSLVETTAEVEPYGQAQVRFDLSFPRQSGRYQLVAQREGNAGGPAASRREFVVSAIPQP